VTPGNVNAVNDIPVNRGEGHVTNGRRQVENILARFVKYADAARVQCALAGDSMASDPVHRIHRPWSDLQTPMTFFVLDDECGDVFERQRQADRVVAGTCTNVNSGELVKIERLGRASRELPSRTTPGPAGLTGLHSIGNVRRADEYRFERITGDDFSVSHLH